MIAVPKWPSRQHGKKYFKKHKKSGHSDNRSYVWGDLVCERANIHDKA